MRVLVTGADGFVGRALATCLSTQGHQLTVAVRKSRPEFADLAVHNNWKLVSVGDIGPGTDWGPALDGADAVVHLAARAHIMQDRTADPLAEFRRVNVQGTERLAQMAAAAGVRRFLYLSSIKVNGERTPMGRPYTADDAPAPADPYGVSKLEAEDGLRHLANETGMELVIIRPPLVYGPGVKANFLTMMRWLRKGVPLPLGAVHNRRSLVALDNLVDFIRTCLDHPAAANQIFLVSDGDDLSTTDLLRRMARALHVPARLLPVPQDLLEWVARLFGRGDLSQRLCASLQLDISKARSRLEWQPPVPVETALRLTAEHFLNNRKKDE